MWRHPCSSKTLLDRYYARIDAAQPIPGHCSKDASYEDCANPAPRASLYCDLEKATMVISITEFLNMSDEERNENADDSGANSVQEHCGRRAS
jgi:hypothetical protein